MGLSYLVEPVIASICWEKVLHSASNTNFQGSQGIKK